MAGNTARSAFHSRQGAFLPPLLCLAIVLLSAGAVPALPELEARQDTVPAERGKIIDQIVATVDDEVILLGELLSDLQLYVHQTGELPDPEQQERLLGESLDNRIREKLLIAKARRDEIQIGEEDIERALDQHIERLIQQAGGEARFIRELEREGLTERDLRKKLMEPMSDQLLIQRILDRVSYGVIVDEEEVLRFYEENRNKPDVIPLRPRTVVLGHILLRPQADPEQEERIQAKLRQARERLDAGEDFAAVARELSEGPAASRGGDLGWFRLQDIALVSLQQVLAIMAPGELRYDVISEQGYHILKLEERSGAQVRFRQIFVSQAIGEADRQRARQLAREAWQRLDEGGDWDAIVKEYSEDDSTRDEGGLLPLIPEEQLEERYRSIVEALEPGEFSSVFLGGRGYQVIRLVEREEARPFQCEEISEELRAELLMRKRNDVLESYLGGLEEEILVRRRSLPALDEIAGLGEGP